MNNLNTKEMFYDGVLDKTSLIKSAKKVKDCIVSGVRTIYRGVFYGTEPCSTEVSDTENAVLQLLNRSSHTSSNSTSQSSSTDAKNAQNESVVQSRQDNASGEKIDQDKSKTTECSLRIRNQDVTVFSNGSLPYDFPEQVRNSNTEKNPLFTMDTDGCDDPFLSGKVQRRFSNNLKTQKADERMEVDGEDSNDSESSFRTAKSDFSDTEQCQVNKVEDSTHPRSLFGNSMSLRLSDKQERCFSRLIPNWGKHFDSSLRSSTVTSSDCQFCDTNSFGILKEKGETNGTNEKLRRESSRSLDTLNSKYSRDSTPQSKEEAKESVILKNCRENNNYLPQDDRILGMTPSLLKRTKEIVNEIVTLLQETSDEETEYDPEPFPECNLPEAYESERDELMEVTSFELEEETTETKSTVNETVILLHESETPSTSIEYSAETNGEQEIAVIDRPGQRKRKVIDCSPTEDNSNEERCKLKKNNSYILNDTTVSETTPTLSPGAIECGKNENSPSIDGATVQKSNDSNKRIRGDTNEEIICAVNEILMCLLDETSMPTQCKGSGSSTSSARDDQLAESMQLDHFSTSLQHCSIPEDSVQKEEFTKGLCLKKYTTKKYESSGAVDDMTNRSDSGLKKRKRVHFSLPEEIFDEGRRQVPKKNEARIPTRSCMRSKTVGYFSSFENGKSGNSQNVAVSIMEKPKEKGRWRKYPKISTRHTVYDKIVHDDFDREEQMISEAINETRNKTDEVVRNSSQKIEHWLEAFRNNDTFENKNENERKISPSQNEKLNRGQPERVSTVDEDLEKSDLCSDENQFSSEGPSETPIYQTKRADNETRYTQNETIGLGKENFKKIEHVSDSLKNIETEDSSDQTKENSWDLSLQTKLNDIIDDEVKCIVIEIVCLVCETCAQTESEGLEKASESSKLNAKDDDTYQSNMDGENGCIIYDIESLVDIPKSITTRGGFSENTEDDISENRYCVGAYDGDEGDFTQNSIIKSEDQNIGQGKRPSRNSFLLDQCNIMGKVHPRKAKVKAKILIKQVYKSQRKTKSLR